MSMPSPPDLPVRNPNSDGFAKGLQTLGIAHEIDLCVVEGAKRLHLGLDPGDDLFTTLYLESVEPIEVAHELIEAKVRADATTDLDENMGIGSDREISFSESCFHERQSAARVSTC